MTYKFAFAGLDDFHYADDISKHTARLAEVRVKEQSINACARRSSMTGS